MRRGRVQAEPGTSERAGTGGGGAGGDDSVCTLAPVLEPCEPFGGFYHDPQTNECLHTLGFQCAAAPNAFVTLADCLAACPSAKPGMATCDLPTDCALASLGCCGLCPTDPITAAQALNASRLAARPVCGDVACGACPPADPNTARVQNYVPVCNLGQCSVEDISETGIVQCEVDDDCHLRDGASCCEQCDGSGLVALSSEALLAADVCGGSTSCTSCAHSYDGYRARCEDNHCRVEAVNTPNNGGMGGGGAGCAGSPPSCRGFDVNACCEQDPYAQASCLDGAWVCQFPGAGTMVLAPGCNGQTCGFGGQAGNGAGGQAGN